MSAADARPAALWQAAAAAGLALLVNAAILGALWLLGASARSRPPPAPGIERWPSVSLRFTPTSLRVDASTPSPAVAAPAAARRRVLGPSPRAPAPPILAAPEPPTASRAADRVPVSLAGLEARPAAAARPTHPTWRPVGPAPTGSPPLADRAPTELSVPPPVYPRSLRRRGVEGRVLVRLRIGVDGRVARCEILRVEGSRRFERAVREALPRWRFEPAVRAGRPAPAWVVKSIRFELRDAR